LLVQLEALRQRRIELGFGGITERASDDDIAVETLYEEPLVAVASLENPWARRKVKLSELVNDPWTLPAAGMIIDSLVIRAFRLIGIEPPCPTTYADAYSLRMRLAATGRFLAIVPASIIRFPGTPSSIKVLPVDRPMPRRQIGTVTLKNRTLSPSFSTGRKK
jgi:DNA-binding transcriptional LysR family regulator